MKKDGKMQGPTKAELKAKVLDLEGQVRDLTDGLRSASDACEGLRHQLELNKLNASKQGADSFGYQSPEREGPILAFKYHQALKAILVAAPQCETCRALQSISRHTLDKFGGGK